jgi:hypothetical protein
MVKRSDAAILEGARLHVTQPHGWGISMSKSGEFQMCVNISQSGSTRVQFTIACMNSSAANG